MFENKDEKYCMNITSEQFVSKQKKTRNITFCSLCSSKEIIFQSKQSSFEGKDSKQFLFISYLFTLVYLSEKKRRF